jgi:hypothetical protein
MGLPGVVGTGIGACEEGPCIDIFVEGDGAALEDRIPAAVEGCPVRLVAVGKARDRRGGADESP